MFEGLVKVFGVEKKVSKAGRTYHIIAVDKGIDVLKLYCELETLPVLNRGEEVELTIDINKYDKPIVTKIVK